MKKECPNCRCDMSDQIIVVKTEDGYEVCSKWCRDDWEIDL